MHQVVITIARLVTTTAIEHNRINSEDKQFLSKGKSLSVMLALEVALTRSPQVAGKTTTDAR